MKRLKENKGITLIALIITIIVMLILVAVTVNVAINGGLFGEANKAATGTEEEAIYDQIVSAMVLEDKGKLNVSETATAAIADLKGKGYTISPEEVSEGASEVTLTVTGQKGTYKYLISKEEVEIIGKDDDYTGGELVFPIEGAMNEKITVKLDENGVLTFAGEGDMNGTNLVDVFTSNFESGEAWIFESIVLEGGSIEDFDEEFLEELEKEEGIKITADQLKELKIKYKNFPEIKSVIVAEGITSLDCGTLPELITEITLPSTLTKIGDYTFDECNINNITIPLNVKFIGNDAFHHFGGETINFEAASLDGITVLDSTLNYKINNPDDLPWLILNFNS